MQVLSVHYNCYCCYRLSSTRARQRRKSWVCWRDSKMATFHMRISVKCWTSHWSMHRSQEEMVIIATWCFQGPTLVSVPYTVANLIKVPLQWSNAPTHVIHGHSILLCTMFYTFVYNVLCFCVQCSLQKNMPHLGANTVFNVLIMSHPIVLIDVLIWMATAVGSFQGVRFLLSCSG